MLRLRARGILSQKAFGMSIHDDMFKAADPNWDLNPYNPSDLSTPYGRENIGLSYGHWRRSTLLTGWPRRLLFAFILGMFLMVAFFP